jgi:hypothetical protein
VEAADVRNVKPTCLLDDRGDHATVCRKLARFTLQRHNRLARTIAKLAKEGGLDADASTSGP